MAGGSDTHKGLVSRLSKGTGFACLSFDYRLSPEAPYPAALEDAVAVYQYVRSVAEDYRIHFVGDSAGGNLVLATLQQLRDRKEKQPKSAVLLAPWLDLTASGASIKSNAERDLILNERMLHLCAKSFIGDIKTDDPKVSPLFGDLEGLCPLKIVVGSDDILCDDSIRLAERLKALGIYHELDLWPEMQHVFPILAPFIPEAQKAIDQISGFVRREGKPMKVKEASLTSAIQGLKTLIPRYRER